jgi:hypothetical protein
MPTHSTRPTRLTRYNVHLSPDQIGELQRLYELDGIRPATRVRRAISTYLGWVTTDTDYRERIHIDHPNRRAAKRAK